MAKELMDYEKVGPEVTSVMVILTVPSKVKQAKLHFDDFNEAVDYVNSIVDFLADGSKVTINRTESTTWSIKR